MSNTYTHAEWCRLIDSIAVDRQQCNYEKVIVTLKQIINEVIPQMCNGDDDEVKLRQGSFKFELVQAEALGAFISNDRLAGEKLNAAIRYVEEYYASKTQFEYAVFAFILKQNDIIGGAEPKPDFIENLKYLLNVDRFHCDDLYLLPIMRRLAKTAEAVKDNASLIALARCAYEVQARFARCIDDSREFGDFLERAALAAEAGKSVYTGELFRFWLWHSSLTRCQSIYCGERRYSADDKEYIDGIRLRLLEMLIDCRYSDQKLTEVVWDEKRCLELKPGY